MKRVHIDILAALVAAVLAWSCQSSEEKAREAIEKGTHLMLASDFRGALEAFDQAVQYAPEYPEAYYQRGNAWYNLREPQKAIEDYTLAIQLDSTMADAWFNRGNVWFYLDDRQRSCDDWKEAERLGKPNVGDKTRFCP